MILATLALAQAWRPIRTVDIDGLYGVVASERSGEFFAYQTNFGRGKDAVLVFDRSGDTRSRFDLPSPRFLAGTDSEGNLVFHERSATLSTRRGSEIGGSDWQPDLSPLTVRGDWALRHDLDGLVVFHKRSPVSLIKDVEDSDAYGIDPESGQVAVLRTRRRRLSLSRYEPGGKGRKAGLSDRVGRKVGDGFPLCSLEFLDRKRVVCALGLSARPESSGETSGLFLCAVDLRTGKVSSLAKLAAPQGDLPASTRNAIAVLGRTVAVASGGKLVFLELT